MTGEGPAPYHSGAHSRPCPHQAGCRPDPSTSSRRRAPPGSPRTGVAAPGAGSTAAGAAARPPPRAPCLSPVPSRASAPCSACPARSCRAEVLELQSRTQESDQNQWPVLGCQLSLSGWRNVRSSLWGRANARNISYRLFSCRGQFLELRSRTQQVGSKPVACTGLATESWSG